MYSQFEKNNFIFFYPEYSWSKLVCKKQLKLLEFAKLMAKNFYKCTCYLFRIELTDIELVEFLRKKTCNIYALLDCTIEITKTSFHNNVLKQTCDLRNWTFKSKSNKNLTDFIIKIAETKNGFKSLDCFEIWKDELSSSFLDEIIIKSKKKSLFYKYILFKLEDIISSFKNLSYHTLPDKEDMLNIDLISGIQVRCILSDSCIQSKDRIDEEVATFVIGKFWITLLNYLVQHWWRINLKTMNEIDLIKK